MLLKDKIAVVTGGGVGIGKAIALRYAKEGAHAVVAEVNEATSSPISLKSPSETGIGFTGSMRKACFLHAGGGA
jgi:NAD(P)-dependent dehydrogenase (short-subunit alcohol dehydrogenase family)